MNLSKLLHTGDPPARTAFAFALGVFFGFSPMVGLHTVLGLTCAFALNLNRIAVLAGVYANLPWFFAPYYALTTAAAAAAMGVTLPPDMAEEFSVFFQHSPLEAQFWSGLGMFRPLLGPFMVGSLVGAALLAVVGYRLALVYLLARRSAADKAVTEGF